MIGKRSRQMRRKSRGGGFRAGWRDVEWASI